MTMRDLTQRRARLTACRMARDEVAMLYRAVAPRAGNAEEAAAYAQALIALEQAEKSLIADNGDPRNP